MGRRPSNHAHAALRGSGPEARRDNHGVRVVALGGTGFIGSYVVRALVQAGHDVTVFHRGPDKPDLPAGLRHVYGPFDRLADHRDAFQRLKPEVVLDMVPFIDKGGHGIAHFRGVADRAVVDLERRRLSGIRASMEERARPS